MKPKTKAGALEIKNIRWKSGTLEDGPNPSKIKIQTKLVNEIVKVEK
jgi:hypothetical protein